MALSKERKAELVAEYTDLLRQSEAIIFTEYRGLTNAELTRLRHMVREANGAFHVCKLTLLELALEEAGYPRLPEELYGRPIAISFCLQDVPGVAKALTSYAGETPFLIVRGGLMGQTALDASQIKALAELPPLDVIRAQILGLLDAPAAGLVGVVQAGVAQVVNVLHAYIESGEAAPAAAG